MKRFRMKKNPPLAGGIGTGMSGGQDHLLKNFQPHSINLAPSSFQELKGVFQNLSSLSKPRF